MLDVTARDRYGQRGVVFGAGADQRVMLDGDLVEAAGTVAELISHCCDYRAVLAQQPDRFLVRMHPVDVLVEQPVLAQQRGMVRFGYRLFEPILDLGELAMCLSVKCGTLRPTSAGSSAIRISKSSFMKSWVICRTPRHGSAPKRPGLRPGAD